MSSKKGAQHPSSLSAIGSVIALIVAISAALPLTLREGSWLAVAAGIAASASVALTATVVSSYWAKKAREDKADVFVSYSMESREIAGALILWLREAGFRVWDPQSEILPGDNLERRISMGVGDAKVLVVVLPGTPSPWVAYEVGLAQGAGKTVIPIFTSPEGRRVAGQLAPDVAHLDAMQLSEDVMQRLLAGVESATGRHTKYFHVDPNQDP